MTTGNLWTGIPHSLPSELVEVLWQASGLRAERIVSRQHASPPDFWYDQDTDEWALLLTGSAGLRIEGRADVLTLRPGDYVVLPAGQRHRVEWTDPDHDTIWLTIHAARTVPR